MKRFGFVASCLILFSLAVPLVASAQFIENKYEWDYMPVEFRNTTAASTVARETNWAKISYTSGAFADSTVASRAGANAVGAPDTTKAYQIKQFKIPDIGRKGATALVDTSTTVWLEIEGAQDTTAYSANNSTTVLDSMQVAAEISWDGISWYSVCCADPTRNFDATAPIPINGTDGATPEPLLAVEVNNNERVRVVLKCDAHTDVLGVGSYIINRTLCMTSASYVRFLIGFPGGGGHFKSRIGYWREVN